MILLRHLAALTIAASALALAGRHKPTQTVEGAEVLGTPNDVHPEAGCQVRGVWELVSISQNGKDQPLAGYRGMKVLTDRHFMFVGQAARRDTLPLKPIWTRCGHTRSAAGRVPTPLAAPRT